MTFPLTAEVLGAAFVAACRAEIAALKPGNVHVHAGGHGMETRHFEVAALAAAPWIADASLTVGERILRAVDASLAAAGLNANLGIVLLCAPLAAAAELPPSTNEAPDARSALRRRLAAVLARLDREDAEAVYRAIVRANPAGLGTVAAEDVTRTPSIPLVEAMALAADRDRIARAYVTGFEDILDFGLDELGAARSLAASESDAITTLHMCFLAAFPDSHIVRKHGMDAALRVRDRARERAALWRPAVQPNAFAELLQFDCELKKSGLNPGTTADLVVATIYAADIIARTVAEVPA
jgi:triphosphoribosyl-dephospho-CoA synthase